MKYIKNMRLDKQVQEFIQNKVTNFGTISIKTGQMLSSRKDLLPGFIIRGLSGLQDNVIRKGDNETIKSVSNHVDNYESMDYVNPISIASASIACVFKGHLKDGKEVAIKVKRDNIDTELTKEFKNINKYLIFSKYFNQYFYEDTIEIVTEIYNQSIYELDYANEIKNTKIMKELLKEKKWVIIPEVHEELCNENVIVMDYVPGIKIDQLDKLRTMKVDTKKLAYKLMDLFTETLLKSGYIHCDPHPGNISINDEGKVIIYDHGLVKKLDDNYIDSVKKIFYYIQTNDIDNVIKYLIKSKTIVDCEDLMTDPKKYDTTKKLIKYVLDYMKDLDIQNLANTIKNDPMFNNKKNIPFKVNPEILTIVRAFTILEGLCKTLDPTFSYEDIIQKYFVKYLLTGDVLKEVFYFITNK